jgi:hypothetical protein
MMSYVYNDIEIKKIIEQCTHFFSSSVESNHNIKIEMFSQEIITLNYI